MTVIGSPTEFGSTEEYLVTFDFASRLAEGVTISSAVVVLEEEDSGEDVSDTCLTGEVYNQDGKAGQKVTGLEDGVHYRMRVTITDSAGQKHSDTLVIKGVF